MVENNSERRPPGRPRQFDPVVALDRAVEVFWRDGYEGADTETLAKAMGVTKPSIYGAFGSKEALFLRSLERYAATAGAEQLSALLDAPDARSGVIAFFEKAARGFAGERGPTGCLHVCVASESAEKLPAVRSFLAAVTAQADQAIATYFERAVSLGDLSPSLSPEKRARLLVDLARGLAIRGRAGTPLPELLTIAGNHAEIVLAS